MKFTSEYLYDTPGSAYRDMGYIEALEFKILKGRELLNRLRRASRKAMCRNDMKHIYISLKIRYEAVEDAIGWNRDMIKEAS